MSERNIPKDLAAGTSDAGLDEPADSIRDKGLLSPIMVRPRDDGSYDLIAGQMRFPACRRFGWTETAAKGNTHLAPPMSICSGEQEGEASGGGSWLRRNAGRDRCTVSCQSVRPDASDCYPPTSSHFDSTAAPRARGRLLEQAVVTRPAPERFVVGGGP